MVGRDAGCCDIAVHCGQSIRRLEAKKECISSKHGVRKITAGFMNLKTGNICHRNNQIESLEEGLRGKTSIFSSIMIVTPPPPPR